MKLAAVVITRNEARGIRSTLQRIVAPDVEIIVADGDSTDGTPDIAAEFARVVRLPPSRGRQLAIGAAAASADVAALVFVHADTRLPAGYAQAIDRCLRDRTIVGGAFRRGFGSPDRSLRVLAWVDNLRARLTGIYLGDQAIFARRDAYLAAGGFPPLPLFEDVAFSRALRRQGRTRLLPLSVHTSERRFRSRGTLPTFARMLALWCLYWLGADPHWLARRYQSRA